MRVVKTESTRKLSNFNFYWTKTLYQNNLSNTAFFSYIPKAIRTGAQENERQMLQELWKQR